MLLRRISHHIKDQNWFAVALDFIIVVAGILIAFQITNWNEARNDRGEEIQYLRALQADMDASLIVLDNQLNFLNRQNEAQRVLADYSAQNIDDLSAERIDQLVHVGVYELYSLGPPQTAFEEMKSSGKLSLIQSVELRKKLQELEAALAVVAAWQADVSEMYYRFSDPFLIETYPVRNIVTNQTNKPGIPNTPWLDTIDPGEDVLRKLRSQRFQNIILYRGNIGAGLRETTRALRPLYEDIDRLVAERLKTLGEEP